MWTRNRKNIHNGYELESINLQNDWEAIHEIVLYKLEEKNFKKLKQAMRRSPLEKVLLMSCFDKSETLREILETIVENTSIKNLELELRDNEYDVHCVNEIRKIVSRKVLKKLTLPQGLNESETVEILNEFIEAQSPIALLNISGSVINDVAMGFLENIINNRLVTDRLVLTGCEGVAKTTLTTKQKEMLEKAEKNSRTVWRTFTRQKLKIVWFNYVEHASMAEYDENYEVRNVVEDVRPFFKGKVGKVEKVARLIARHKMGGPWQHIRSGRKRRNDEIDVDQPKMKKEREADDIAEIFDKGLKIEPALDSSTPMKGNGLNFTQDYERSMDGFGHMQNQRLHNNTQPYVPDFSTLITTPTKSKTLPFSKEKVPLEKLPKEGAIKHLQVPNNSESSSVDITETPSQPHCSYGSRRSEVEYYSHVPPTSALHHIHTSPQTSSIGHFDNPSSTAQKINFTTVIQSASGPSNQTSNVDSSNHFQGVMTRQQAKQQFQAENYGSDLSDSGPKPSSGRQNNRKAHGAKKRGSRWRFGRNR